jgi:diguanylate cyclase (GGDEF)-like protein
MTRPGKQPVEGEFQGLGLWLDTSWIKRRSSVGVRIAARLAVIFLVFGIVQFFVVRGITRRQFQDIERTNLLERTRQVFLTFDRESAFLKTLTTSTAAWRDTYEFAIHPTQAYLARNYGGDWPKTYNIDFVLMVGMDGRKIWSSDSYPAFPLMGPGLFSVDRFDRNNPYIFPQGFLFSHDYQIKPTDSFTGLISSDGRTWIYCAHAITNDDLTGPPRGMLIFGRLIDAKTLSDYVSGLSDELTLVPASAIPLEGPSDDRTIASEFSSYGGTYTSVQTEGDRLVSYSPISDFAGKLIGALRLSILRRNEAAGTHLVWLTSLSLLAAALITLFAILLAIRATVILPITRLAAYLTAQGEGRDEVLKMKTQRDDEIGVLAEQARVLITKVKEQHAELESQANTDRLTGLPNRRSFDSHINKEFRRLLRSRRGNQKKGQMAVVVIDVDHFKLFNDTNGHVAGDACLRAIAESIRSCISRAGDLACRFGGEEFVVVLPDTDEAGALVVAEAIRLAVEHIALPHTTSPVAKVVTVSAGVAALEVEENFQIELLIEWADQALYAAKNAGRNRVVGSTSLV